MMRYKYCLIVFFILQAIVSSSQDLTDEKNIKKIKSIKYICSKDQNHSIILSDNTFLNVKYNVIVDGEFNANYTFIEVQDELSGRKNLSNKEYFIKNIDKYCQTLNLGEDVKKSVINELDSISKDPSSEGLFLTIKGIKDYDEFTINVKKNQGVIIVCFFFRRLL